MKLFTLKTLFWLMPFAAIIVSCTPDLEKEFDLTPDSITIAKSKMEDPTFRAVVISNSAGDIFYEKLITATDRLNDFELEFDRPAVDLVHLTFFEKSENGATFHNKTYFDIQSDARFDKIPTEYKNNASQEFTVELCGIVPRRQYAVHVGHRYRKLLGTINDSQDCLIFPNVLRYEDEEFVVAAEAFDPQIIRFHPNPIIQNDTLKMHFDDLVIPKKTYTHEEPWSSQSSFSSYHFRPATSFYGINSGQKKLPFVSTVSLNRDEYKFHLLEDLDFEKYVGLEQARYGEYYELFEDEFPERDYNSACPGGWGWLFWEPSSPKSFQFINEYDLNNHQNFYPTRYITFTKQFSNNTGSFAKWELNSFYLKPFKVNLPKVSDELLNHFPQLRDLDQLVAQEGTTQFFVESSIKEEGQKNPLLLDNPEWLMQKTVSICTSIN